MSADWITISDGELSATINPLGAELSSLTDGAGREWMTDADPAFWSGRSPLLFPIVGALNGGGYRIGEQRVELPQHGFARRRRFELVEQAADSVRFRLSDDDETRAVYPFAFTLDAEYRLAGGTLTVDCTVANRGEGPMPASFGYHPAFAWPLPGEAEKAGHHIVFERREPALLARLAGGLLAGLDRSSPLRPDQRTLALEDDLFADDALIWTSLESRKIDYLGTGRSRLRIEFPNAPALGIWTKPGARFICIEPWWGHADPAGFADELWDKPGMMVLQAGEERSFVMSLTPFTG